LKLTRNIQNDTDNYCIICTSRQQRAIMEGIREAKMTVELKLYNPASRINLNIVNNEINTNSSVLVATNRSLRRLLSLL
jgi:hypothetical protein